MLELHLMCGLVHGRKIVFLIFFCPKTSLTVPNSWEATAKFIKYIIIIDIVIIININIMTSFL